MALPTKFILLGLGIILGFLLSFGASDNEIVLKNKTQEDKDIIALVARGASFVSLGIFILTILKKIRIRPTWAYFVMGVSITFSIMSIVILPIAPLFG
jgi:hypothetical protein